MLFLQDPIIIVFLSLALFGLVVAFQPTRWPMPWLVVLTILFFAFPRAGFSLQKSLMPLPLAHILTMVLAMEWFIRRRIQPVGPKHFPYVFILYASVAFLGAGIGLSTGGNAFLIFQEICFYLFSMAIFFFVVDTFRQRRHFILFIHLIFIIAAGVSLYGIAQRFLGEDILIPHLTYTSSGLDFARSYIKIPNSIFNRVLSSYGDPNVLSAQLVFFVGVCFAVLIGKNVPVKYRLLTCGVLILCVLCIVYTSSRAALICLFLVPLMVIALKSRWTLLGLATALPIILFLSFGRIAEFANTHLAGILEDERVMYPRKLLDLLVLAPFGCGFGNKIITNLTGTELIFSIQTATNAWDGWNSFWLNLVMRLGFQGLIAFVLMVGILMHYVYRQSRQIHHPLAKAVVVGALAGFTGQALIWMVNNTFMLPGGGLNFWFMMGMIVMGSHVCSREPIPVLVPVQPAWPDRQVVPVT